MKEDQMTPEDELQAALKKLEEVRQLKLHWQTRLQDLLAQEAEVMREITSATKLENEANLQVIELFNKVLIDVPFTVNQLRALVRSLTGGDLPKDARNGYLACMKSLDATGYCK